MISIHFPGLRPDLEALPVARALGLGLRVENSPEYLYHFSQLLQEAPKLWQPAPPESADIFIFPYLVEPHHDLNPIALAAKDRGLPCIFFRSTDDATPFDVPHGVIYRDSIFADKRNPKELALASFAGDMLTHFNGQLQIRPKSLKPSIGFCGFVGTAWSRTLYRLAGKTEKAIGLTLRHRALQALRRSPRVQTDFIVRTQYWFGGGRAGQRNLQESHREYVHNVFNNDYTLCIRGAGNFSFRFYETLAAGRIPLFVNTRCVLPFEDRIDYKKHCAWAEESDMRNLGNRLAEFHERLTPAAFEEMQRANRRLWEDWFEPLAFYKRILADALPGKS